MSNYKKYVDLPADEYGYQKDNPRHQESYWQGRPDPRDKDDSYMKYNSVYYGMIDRQIAADHHERTQGQGSAGGSSSSSAQNANAKK